MKLKVKLSMIGSIFSLSVILAMSTVFAIFNCSSCAEAFKRIYYEDGNFLNSVPEAIELEQKDQVIEKNNVMFNGELKNMVNNLKHANDG